MNTAGASKQDMNLNPSCADSGSTPYHVVIIGGGISGLSAGWYLERYAAEAGLSLRYAILEESERWGGKILTEQIETTSGESFLVEAGPDSFLTQKPWGLELARELGLEDRVLDTNDHLRRVFVLKQGKLVPLPDGVFLIIPTRIMPFALSPLISWPGKVRMALDWFIPPKRDGADETIRAFVERRLGSEAVDRLAEPLMSGIYNAEADRQSLLATFPRFRELEVQHGSLIKGMMASRRAGKGPAPARQNGKKHALFVSLNGGMKELVDQLLKRLRGDLRLNSAVQSISLNGEGPYLIGLQNGQSLEADQVMLTTPAFISARLLADLTPRASVLLSEVRYVSTGTVSLAFHVSEVSHPLDGFGVVIPQSEKRRINAITWTSTKFDHRAPADHVLLRVFFGGSRRPEMMEKPDEELLRIVLAELKNLMGIDAPPVLQRIYRWQRGNPQYDVGHLDRMDETDAALPEGLHLAGSAYRGIGIPDCVRQARESAHRVIEALREHTSS